MWSKLKKLRKKRGYSCKQVADILHISDNTYRRYEQKPLTIRADKLAMLANLYNVSINELLGDALNDV